MNGNSYPNPSQSINPALLASFQAHTPNKFSNYAGQLINGGPSPQAAMNPSQVLQQQHIMNGGMGMGNIMGMGSMMGMPSGSSGAGMSINPSTLANSNPPAPHHPNPQINQNANINFNMGMMLNAMGMTKEQFGAMTPQERQMTGAKMMHAAQQQAQHHQHQQQQHHHQQHQQQQTQAHAQAQMMLGSIGGGGSSMLQNQQSPPFSQNQQQQHLQQREQQFQREQQMQQRDREHQLQRDSQQQQQDMMARGGYYDRPSSSASSHTNSNPGSGQNPMMPPPPQSQSRPGTALAQHSPTGMALGQRPDSRGSEFGQGFGMMPNGYPKSAPSSQQQQQPQGFPGQQQVQIGPPQIGQNPYPQNQGSPPPIPGSPYRGSKRKVGGGVDVSPRMASMAPGPGVGGGLMGMGMGNMMGPPGLPRSISSGENLPFQQQQPPQMNGYAQSASPRPPSAGSGMMGDEQMRMGGGGPMNMGIGMAGDGMPSRPPPQPQQHQRQGSIPPHYPGLGLGPQTSLPQQGPPSSQLPPHMRQSSVPPPLPNMLGSQQMTPQKVPHDPMGLGLGEGLKMDMGMRASVPPPPAMSSVPSGSSVVSGGGPPPAVPVAPLSQPPPSAGPGGVVPQLSALPAGVTLNPVVTRVSVVPLVDSLTTIPALSEAEIEDVQGWMKVDKEYEAVYRKMKERMGEEVREVFGPAGAAWWEKGALDVNPNKWRRGREPFDVRYPRHQRKDREGRERKKAGRREGLRLPRKLDPEDANRPEQLVPIRLEFDVEHHKMRDTFVWNLNDPVVTPENFAQSVVEDYNLASSYHAVIIKSIQDQLSDYKAHSANYDGEGGDITTPEDMPKRGTLDEASTVWWESWRKRLRTDSGHVRSGKVGNGKGRKRRKVIKEESGNVGEKEETKHVGFGAAVGAEEPGFERPMTLDELEMDERLMNEEMRVLIKLDIIVGSMKLDDQFEWDMDNENASPEEFAEIYAQELGLGGEFRTAIAHCIREQVQIYQKSLFLVGHPSDGTAVLDDDLRLSFLPSLSSGARSVDQVQSFTPLLNYLSDGELEKTEKDRDKDMNKRRKRNTRGRRGIALPDREPIRTYRTPAIGFPELDPATLALAVAANAPMSRRAAAAAASLTIANMVASENGTAFLPQTMPSAPQPMPMALKEKKTKGLFKAPSYPSSVLRPRAHVTAPIPSTAADVTILPAPMEPDILPPSTSTVAPDSKVSKVIIARRAKEKEREAKEKEFADGQHSNFIDGVWHCSNCGCPESIAIGRRKGPLGDKSQCGTCGKYWHRHRRPRPVEYNADPDFHSGAAAKREAEAAKASAKKRGGAAAALRAQGTSTSGELASEPPTPSRSNGDTEVPSRNSPPPAVVPSEDERAISPVSTASSSPEPPLAQRVRVNGNSHTPSSAPAPTPPMAAAVLPSRPVESPVVNAAPASAENAPPSSPSKPSWPPQWLASATQAMQAKYANDRFEVLLRKVNATTPPEWRIKCLDCPGKLYTPGPGETLSNYEVHLKNRLHRQRVNDRMTGASSNSNTTGSTNSMGS